MPPTSLDPSIDVRARRRIQQWMAVTHTSQAILAARIGKDQPWMSRYLAGSHDADLATLERIALAFGHTLFALLDVPGDAQEAHLVEMYRAMRPTTRATVVRLLEDLTRPRQFRRGTKAPAGR